MAINGKMISVLGTEAGTKVTKYFEPEAMKKGYGCIKKVIEYPKNSKLARAGIDTVVIRDAGEEGKRIMAFGGNTCRFLGVTNPACKHEQSVITQFKEYLNTVRLMERFGLK